MTPTVVVTRPLGPYTGAERLLERVRALGYPCIHLPVLQIVRAPLTEELKEEIAKIQAGEIDWLVLLSPSAVHSLHEAQKEFCNGAIIPAKVSIAVQGAGTDDAVQDCFGRRATLVASNGLAEVLAEELVEVIKRGEKGLDVRVLLLQAKDGRDIVRPILEREQIEIAAYPLYTTNENSIPNDIQEAFQSIPPINRIYLFMSPSAVRATKNMLGSDSAESYATLCVGPITSRAARDAGFKKVHEAEEFSEEGLLKLLNNTIAGT